MTVASQTARQQHDGNGVTVAFTTGFAFSSNSYVRVIHTDENGVDTAWVENTNYTLTGAGTGAAGTVTVKTTPTDYTPATDETLTILLNVPNTQTLDANTLETLPASDIEDSLDKVWLKIQQINEVLARAYVSDETGDGGPPTALDLEEIGELIDDFDTRYLGAFAANPTTDNDGGALAAGMLYYNTVSTEMRVYDGAAWQVTYNPSSGAVDSIFGRTGVVAAVAGDYDAAEITFDPAGLDHTDATDLQEAIADHDVAIEALDAFSGLAVGTAATNVVQLDGAGALPAVSGANLTGLSALPVGSVIPFAGASLPTDWLFCYGQAVSRTTFSELFTAIGEVYGVGDGSTTFNVPDLRGRVVAGQDDMGGTSANRLTDQSGGLDGDVLGDTGGAETHTLTIAQLAAHTHPQLGGATPGGASLLIDATTGATAAGNTGSTGSGAAHNNVQPTIILNYIIFANAS